MVNVETVVGLALAQQGDRYVGNAEADPANPNPSEWDCSELVQWACDRAGVTPAMPDGSWLQQRWCSSQGQIISVDQAIATRGALLFNHRDADGNPVDPGPACPPHAHVAVSLGDGTTIEAMGTKYGVLVASARNRSWTAGALIPGCTYGAAPAPAPTPRLRRRRRGGPRRGPTSRISCRARRGRPWPRCSSCSSSSASAGWPSTAPPATSWT